ncbi:MAG TPA: septum formation inhibitor Maf [Blastocatellia bacterium]|nr:septum formation inhibitor Maf [Blastocatellia bacterium]
MNNKDFLFEKLILASGSPRRMELLRAVGWPFDAVAADIDEAVRAGEDAVSYVKRLALTKAQTVASRSPESLVLGADTTVVVGGEILGQPIDDDDARRMLNLLSGKWHEVLTGVALLRADQEAPLVDHETTRVRFAEMSVEEIDWYVATGEPRGKAGAYGIQGHAALFVEEIAGDYFNIVGLPLRLVYEMVRKSEQEV